MSTHTWYSHNPTFFIYPTSNLEGRGEERERERMPTNYMSPVANQLTRCMQPSVPTSQRLPVTISADRPSHQKKVIEVGQPSLDASNKYFFCARLIRHCYSHDSCAAAIWAGVTGHDSRANPFQLPSKRPHSHGVGFWQAANRRQVTKAMMPEDTSSKATSLLRSQCSPLFR